MKICTACGVSKSVDEFYLRSDRKNPRPEVLRSVANYLENACG